MEKSEVMTTKEIVHRRIVVENSIGRIRQFEILNVVLPIAAAQSQLVSDMVKVIAVLSNLQSAIR